MKRATYVIDDRRYVGETLAAQNRLSWERIREITNRIPDCQAFVRIEGNEKTAVIREITDPDGKNLPRTSLPSLVQDVTLPEILADFRGEPLPNQRKMPLSVIEIRA